MALLQIGLKAKASASNASWQDKIPEGAKRTVDTDVLDEKSFWDFYIFITFTSTGGCCAQQRESGPR
jgi:hypothetical protein